MSIKNESEQDNFLDLVKKRSSIRNFSTKPIEKEKLDYLLEAVRFSPSAVNFQPWSFIVIQDTEKIKKLSECYPRDWFRTSPVCIVACGNHTQSWHRKDGKDHCDIDIAIAVTHMVLAATELQLGSCWVCNFDEKKCCEILNLPEGIEPIALIPIGYPSDPSVFENNMAKRKTIDEIVKWE